MVVNAGGGTLMPARYNRHRRTTFASLPNVGASAGLMVGKAAVGAAEAHDEARGMRLAP